MSHLPTGLWTSAITPVLNTWTGGESARSGTLTAALAAPSLTAATAQTHLWPDEGDIQLAWNSVSAATGYNVYRRTSSGTYDFSAPLNGAVRVTATSYSDPGPGLTGASTYAYVVRALSSTIASPSSNELSATAIARPDAPAGVAATSAASGQIDVAWSSVAGVSDYNVYRRTSTGSYDYAAPLNGSTLETGTSFTDATATDATTYRHATAPSTAVPAAPTSRASTASRARRVTADGIPPNAVRWPTRGRRCAPRSSCRARV